jgi:hypothetical protein
MKERGMTGRRVQHIYVSSYPWVMDANTMFMSWVTTDNAEHLE